MNKIVKRILLGGAVVLIALGYVEYQLFTSSTNAVNAEFQVLKHQNEAILQELCSLQEQLNTAKKQVKENE